MKRKFLYILLPFFLVACAANMGNVPWTLDVQNWTSHQKASFFMTTWLAEKQTYDSMNAIEDKPASLVSVLKSKRKIIENSRIPIRTYSTIVKGGGSPDAETEQKIIDWIRQLQMQIVYGGE